MNEFKQIASFYDYIFSSDAEKWGKKIVKTVKQYAPSPVGIDVGSGTGYFTKKLNENGFLVTGVEPSVDMLNIAYSRGGANYVQGDIKKLKGFTNLGFVTAINDVINYLKPTEIQKAFYSVNRCLQNGGVFIFDYSTEYRLKSLISNNLFGEDFEDLTYMWFNTLKKDGVKQDLVFFSLNEQGTYDRTDESFFEYFHSCEDIETTLKNTGFKIEKIYGNELRKVVIARKI